MKIGGICLVARNAALTGLILAVCACTVVDIEKDRTLRELRGGSFDAAEYVDDAWDSEILPDLTNSAVPVEQLVSRLEDDPQGAEQELGRRSSGTAPVTFVIRGEGVVRSVDARSQTRSVTVEVPGAGRMRLLAGPVIVSSALRDSIPGLRFDDFPDQLAFARLNKALNERALAEAGLSPTALQPGDPISFIGVARIDGEGGAMEIMPVRVGGADDAAG